MIRIKSRTASFLIILVIYVLAFSVAWLVFYLSRNLNIILSTLLADIASTILVWGAGILFGNSSVYDPYWSVAPPVILIFWMMVKEVSFYAADILFLVAIIFWSVRLTINWAKRWKGIGHQDWRYSMLKKRSPKMWFLTNLIGINLMPTLIVFLALVPAYYGTGYSGMPGVLTITGFAICIGATLIEYIADRQIDAFKKTSSKTKDRYIDKGLWRYSRHPNYLGEVSFWWGIWLMQMGIAPGAWYTVAGPVVMTILFIFISIPMMERHLLESRKSYGDYCKKVSMFIPWFRK